MLNFWCFCPHASPLYWFDKEIKPNFGVDVYNHKFDTEEGYCVFNENGIDVFVYRLENLNSLADKIGEFLGDDSFELKKANQADNFWYAEEYKKCIKNISLSEQYLNFLYDSKFSKHFFSSEQIANLKGKWNKDSHVPSTH